MWEDLLGFALGFGSLVCVVVLDDDDDEEEEVEVDWQSLPTYTERDTDNGQCSVIDECSSRDTSLSLLYATNNGLVDSDSSACWQQHNAIIHSSFVVDGQRHEPISQFSVQLEESPRRGCDSRSNEPAILLSVSRLTVVLLKLGITCSDSPWFW